jgi:hypothetical protein
MDKQKEVIDQIKKAIAEIKKCCEGLTFESKQEVVAASAELHNYIMQTPVINRCCNTCEHCIFYDGEACCAARDMAKIPFQVANRVGGCSRWAEKDYIPF